MNVRHLLLGAVVVLIPFQDTILKATPLRYSGTSFAVLPLLALLALDLAGWLASPRKSINLKVTAVVCYCLLLTLAYAAVLGDNWAGVSLLQKSANLAFMTTLAAYMVFRPRWEEFPYLRQCVHAAFGICVAGILFNDLNFLGLRALAANPLFHNTVNTDQRWHGLSPESSILSLAIGSLGLMSTACARSRLGQAFCLALTVALLAFSASKGAVLTLALVGLVLGLLARGQRWKTIAAMVVLSPFLYVGYLQFQRMSTREAISETTTAATRATMILWSTQVVRHHPMGVGYAGFYPSLTRYLPEAMDRINSVSPLPLNFDEVNSYRSTAQYAGTKTFLFDFLTYFGFPFLAAFLVFVGLIVRACRRLNRVLLAITVLFVTVAACTYNGSVANYALWLVYGVGWSQHRKLREHGAALQARV